MFTWKRKVSCIRRCIRKEICSLGESWETKSVRESNDPCINRPVLQQLTCKAHLVKNDQNCNKSETPSKNNKQNRFCFILYCIFCHSWKFRNSQPVLQTVSPRRNLKKSRILRIFEVLSCKHIMIAPGNFYIKNYTNLIPFK